MSAYSQDPDHHQSLITTHSWRGSVLNTTL